MNIILFCLLSISGLPALINGHPDADFAERGIKAYLGNGSNLIDSNIGELVFLDEERLGATKNALVKKGAYNGIEVAIKITWKHAYFVRELAAYEALNATENEEIEKYGIPRIYYHGKIIGEYEAFAITLFEETLGDRYKKQGKPLSDLAAILIMKQAVQTLAYLALNEVVHNDIKPDDIFLRGAEVFIADFGLATLKNDQIPEGGTWAFASSSFHTSSERYAVDDLESLVYSVWYVVGVPMCVDFYSGKNPEGYRMFLSKRTNRCEKRIREQCLHFKDLEVSHTFEFICIQAILHKEKVLDYNNIIALLTGTITGITEKSKESTFEWLDTPQTRRSRLFNGILSMLGKRKRR